MDGKVKRMIGYAGTVVLCSAGLALQALATPPFGKATAAHAGAPAAHLDLRPPARTIDAVGTGRLAAESIGANHSERVALGHRNEDVRDESRLPSLGAGTGQAREMSKAEAFARRFHREGLPVARLWENHSALVSLGLNQKGKLGLWLVQKTH
jgi:hypothetical protein